MLLISSGWASVIDLGSPAHWLTLCRIWLVVAGSDQCWHWVLAETMAEARSQKLGG